MLSPTVSLTHIYAQGRESHLVFTLHIYQYLSNGSGGRSRLHLIDFGGCERTKVQFESRLESQNSPISALATGMGKFLLKRN